MMKSLLQQPDIQIKVAKLLSRMTLSEKIGQMTQAERFHCSPEEAKTYHIGSILGAAGSNPDGNTPKDWLNMIDQYWLASMNHDKDRTAIPIMYATDAIHGHNNVSSATIFPHNIGLGATHDEQLLAEIGKITAKEVMSTGVDWILAPTVAIAENCHWGRSYESYSQDVSLVTKYAPIMVNALQQKQNNQQLAACVKHWLGDGATQYGIDQGNTEKSLSLLCNSHAKPYIEAINAGALSVMVSFSSINGEKCHGSYQLITEKLKQKLNFSGIVISDMDGIDDLNDDFHLSVRQAVNAGIDVFMIPHNWRNFIETVHQHVELGAISMARINDAVSRILSVKFALGLFSQKQPSLRAWANHQSYASMEHKNIAREAVRKSQVLLKNNNNILPLNKLNRLFVAGKNADNLGHQCGGFTIEWQGCFHNDDIKGGTSIWQGIKNIAPNAVLSQDVFAQDIDANKHDVAIVVIGETSYAEGAGDIRCAKHDIVKTGSQINGKLNVLHPYGHSLALKDLHPEDIKTINNISAAGVPIIIILISGRPLIVDEELSKSEAFIAAWLPGSEGQGVADVLFGDFDFLGKLSFNWPSQRNFSNNLYNQETKPLFPIGYGLNYQQKTHRKLTRPEKILHWARGKYAQN